MTGYAAENRDTAGDGEPGGDGQPGGDGSGIGRRRLGGGILALGGALALAPIPWPGRPNGAHRAAAR